MAATFGSTSTAVIDDTGFQVTLQRRRRTPATDVAALGLAHVPSGDVTGFVGETAQGGPPHNGGSTVATTGNHAPVVTAPAA